MATKRAADKTRVPRRHGSSLFATISRRNGMARMLLERADGGAIALTLGPGFAASWGEIGPAGKVREVAISRARAAFAVVTSDLVVSGDRIRRVLLTEYARGIVRRDTIDVDGQNVDRLVRWDLPGKRSAIATYKEWERTLRLLKNGKEVGRMVTTGRPTATGWQSSSGSLYLPLNFEGDELGDYSKLTRPGSLKSTVHDPGDGGTKTIRVSGTSADGELDFLIIQGPSGSAELGQGYRDGPGTAPFKATIDHLELVWKQGYYVGTRVTIEHTNGQVDAFFHWNGGRNEGPGSEANYLKGSIHVTWNPENGGYSADGKWQDATGSGSWHSQTDRNGNAHGTYNKTNKDGSTEDGTWDRTNNGDGSFTDGSYREIRRSDGSTERSASVNDGKGNSSTSTITTGADGKPVLTIVSKGSDGSSTEKKYDENGNEVDPKPPASGSGGGTAGGGDQGNDDDKGDHDHGGTALPVDDGTGSRPSPNTINAMEGYAEMPAGDGSDYEPRPKVAGPGEAAFEKWLAYGSPFLGGASSNGSRFRGNPINRILLAMGDEGDGDGTGQGNDEDDGFSIDLRTILLEERDPEHNPKILFETLARFTGVSPSSGSLDAADRVMQAIRGGD